MPFGLDSANFHVNLCDILYVHTASIFTDAPSVQPDRPDKALKIKHNVHFYARQAIKMP